MGHNNGNLYRTTNGTSAAPAWQRFDASSPLPDRWISRIAIDPRNTNRVYVCFMGYSPDNLWLTEDAGLTWRPIDGAGATGLPDAPVNCIALHPQIPGWLYAATDLGVFYSEDDGATWRTSGDGPANVTVDELIWRNDRIMLAVTHGRGIYEATIGAADRFVAGVPCAVSTVPWLLTDLPVLGQTMDFRLVGAAAGASAILGIGAGPPNPTVLGGCTVHPDLAALTVELAGVADPTGALTYSKAIPLLPALLGADFTAQMLLLDPGGPPAGRIEVTNGQRLTLGF